MDYITQSYNIPNLADRLNGKRLKKISQKKKNQPHRIDVHRAIGFPKFSQPQTFDPFLKWVGFELGSKCGLQVLTRTNPSVTLI